MVNGHGKKMPWLICNGLIMNNKNNIYFMNLEAL